MADSCPYCGSDIHASRQYGPKEAAARRLQRITAGSLPFCRKAVLALMEIGWNAGKINEAIERFAEPGMAPWDWCKEATHKPFRAEPEPAPAPNLGWADMAEAAGMSLEDWKTFHHIGSEAR